MGLKNIVIITSVVNAPRSLSIFTPKERLMQLEYTVKTVREKIPNCEIFIVNSGGVPDDLKTSYEALNVEHRVEASVLSEHKSVGEILMIDCLLSTEEFLKATSCNINKIVKISGRYFLKDEFVFDDTEKVVFKTVEPQNSWSKHGICETRYYSFPFYLLDLYRSGVKRIVNEGVFIDIEHTFYKNKILPFTENSNKIQVAGYLAPNGNYIED